MTVNTTMATDQMMRICRGWCRVRYPENEVCMTLLQTDSASQKRRARSVERLAAGRDLPAPSPLGLRLSGTFLSALVIEQELASIEQCPQEVFVGNLG